MLRRRPFEALIWLTCFMCMLFSFGTPLKTANAAGESVAAPSDITTVSGQNGLALSDDFEVSGFSESANLLVSITVSGSTAAKVNLPTTTGLTLESGYTSWTNTSQINFTGSQTNINAALDAMTLNSGATAGSATLNIEVSEKVNNTAFFNGHLYEFVQGNISYLNARTAARTRTINGVNGYLVTITSDAEHNFVLSKIQGAYNIWIALSDRAVEGDWVLDPYDGSPEQGTLVWRGLSNGSAQGGNYAKWCGGEPNNSGNEDAAVTKWSGGNCWNDLPDSWSSVGGYVAEYNMPSSIVVSDSMNITVENRVLNTPTGLAVSFSGTTANLTWTAPAASNTPVERYAVSWSTDNFASGFGIASLTTSASIPNLTRGTTYQFRVRADNDTYSTYSSYTSSVSATAPQEGNTIIFSYNPTTVYQNVQINTANKTTLLATARAVNVEGSPDLFFLGIELRGVGGGLIYSHNTGWVNLTNSYQDITLTVTSSGVGAEAWALVDSVTLVLGGDDAEFWGGNYGPKVEFASLKLDGTELMSNVEFADGDRYWTSSVGWQTCHATQGNKPCASAGLYVAPTTTTTTTTTTSTTTTSTTTTTTTTVPTTTTTEAPAPETTTTQAPTPIPQTTTTQAPAPTTTEAPPPITTVPPTTTTEPEPEPETTTTTQPEPVETTIPEETDSTTTTTPEPVEEPETTTPSTPADVSPDTTLPEDPVEPEQEEQPTETTVLPQEQEDPEPVSPETTVPEADAKVSEAVEEAVSELEDASPEETAEVVADLIDSVPEDRVAEVVAEVIEAITKVEDPKSLTEEQKEQIVAVVAAVIEAGVSQEVAATLASNPAVLESVSTEQAAQVFESVEAEQLTEEVAEQIVDAVQEAPSDVREVFEDVVDLFQGAFDGYKMLNQNISVGERRTVIAAGLLTASAASMAATGGMSGGSPSSSGPSAPSTRQDTAARREDDEEEPQGEIAGDGLDWIKNISIFKYVNGVKVMDWKAFFKKFSYGLMNMGFTIAGSLVVYLTLSGPIQKIAGISTVLAIAAAMWLHMKEPDTE